MSEEKKSYDFAPKTLGAGFIHKKDLEKSEPILDAFKKEINS